MFECYGYRNYFSEQYIAEHIYKCRINRSSNTEP